MKYIKIILLIVILLFLGIIFYFKQNVEFVLIDTYEKINMDFNGDVELINSRKKLEEFYEKENIYYDINMDNSTVILSRKKIKKINLIYEYKIFPIFTHFIEIYCNNDNKENNIYLYYIPESKVYFDERSNIQTQIR